LYFGLEKPLRLPPSMRDDEGRITHREGDEKDEYPAPAELARMAVDKPAFTSTSKSHFGGTWRAGWGSALPIPLRLPTTR